MVRKQGLKNEMMEIQVVVMGAALHELLKQVGYDQVVQLLQQIVVHSALQGII